MSEESRVKERMTEVAAFSAGTNTGVFSDGSLGCLRVAVLKKDGELDGDVR